MMWKFILLLAIFLENCEIYSANRTDKSLIFKRKAGRGAVMKSYMDANTDPCQDFYQYACGNYPKVIPLKDRSASSHTPFSSTEDRITNYIASMFSDPQEIHFSNEMKYNPNIVTKTKNYFDSCLNADVFSFRKIPEYYNLINEIGGCAAFTKDWNMEQFDWVTISAHIRRYSASALIKEEVLNTTNGVLELEINSDEISLTPAFAEDLEDPKSKPYLLNQELIKRIFILYGVRTRTASKYATNIVDFMRRLQKLSEQYSSETIEGVSKPEDVIPQIDWEKYFSIVLGPMGNRTLNLTINNPIYLQYLPSLILRSDIQTVSNYLAVKFLYTLHTEFQYRKDSKKYCTQILQEFMTPVINAMFVKRYYKSEVENEIVEMTRNIKESFMTILNESDWLDNATRLKAIKKLEATTHTVGITGNILTFDELNERYANLSLVPDNYYQNTLNFRVFHSKREHATKGQKSLDPPEISLVDVNAYYEIESNNIVVPAGIMLPPFYHSDLPKAYTYGLIGTVIGHELTHGFDNDGRYYDEYGREKNWWSKASKRAYNRRTSCMIRQYRNYKVPELAENLDGVETLGENIADNGGIREAFGAYKNWYNYQNSSDISTLEILPGLNMTNLQLFFLSFAQGYCSYIRQSDLEDYLNDTHSLNKYRIIGTLSNFEEFSKQFNCTLGAPMNPVKKCRVW